MNHKILITLILRLRKCQSKRVDIPEQNGVPYALRINVINFVMDWKPAVGIYIECKPASRSQISSRIWLEAA